MKTFDQCKDEVAKKYGYEGWPDMMLELTTKTVELGEIRRKTNEAAELYAQEVAKDAWERACEATRISFESALNDLEVVKPPYQPN